MYPNPNQSPISNESPLNILIEIGNFMQYIDTHLTNLELMVMQQQQQPQQMEHAPFPQQQQQPQVSQHSPAQLKRFAQENCDELSRTFIFVIELTSRKSHFPNARSKSYKKDRCSGRLPNLSRHRLVKWRMHWLPSFPLKDCRCGKSEVNRLHFTNDCPMLAPMIQQLSNSFNSTQSPTIIPPTHTLIDVILNSLPNSPKSLQHGHWRKTWPLLLHTLRDIDICSHPDAIFEPETSPWPVQDNYLNTPTLDTAN